jgi:hypothetical protein
LTIPDAASTVVEKAERLQALPKFVRDWLVYLVDHAQAEEDSLWAGAAHRELGEKFGLTNSIVRVACYCRYNPVDKENWCCYGMSLSHDGSMSEMSHLGRSFATKPPQTVIATKIKGRHQHL